MEPAVTQNCVASVTYIHTYIWTLLCYWEIEISYLLTVLLSVSLKKLPWFLFEETVNYIRIELFAIVFGSLTKFLSLIFIMLQWNGSLYITLIVQMLTSSGFDYGLGTIHILTYISIFLDFMWHTYLICQHKYSPEHKEKWRFSEPNP